MARIFATIKDQVYEALKEDIAAGAYQPGQRLQEIELAEKLSVSRTPVREALRQLVHDGIAVEIPNKGVYVRKFTEKDVKEIYNMRALLEGYAIEQLDGRMTLEGKQKLKDILSRMEAAHAAGDINAYTAIDTELHECFILLADDNLLNTVYRSVQAMVRQFLIHGMSAQHRFEQSILEHQEIVNRLLSGDFAAAKAANTEHLLRARRELLNYASENSDIV